MNRDRLIARLERELSVTLGRAVQITSFVAAGGGCINDAARIILSSGDRLFVKFNTSAPAGMFEREAEGLAHLQKATSLRVPTPLLAAEADADTPAFVVLEDISVPRRQAHAKTASAADFDERLARGLVELHRTQGPAYGFYNDNFIGSTPQPNPWESSWSEFFREQRLHHMIRLLRAQGKLQGEPLSTAIRFLERVDELLAGADAQPSLLHGDLWGGNVMRDGDGSPALIDPACYYGHREADLAMTRLFGGFSLRLYQIYEELFPLAEGSKERFDVYNLYHILNHALLFGGGYLRQALETMRRYSGRR
jgi:fructosamine-3-kinase